MVTDEVHARVSRLVDLLDEAVELLENHGESSWAAWLATSRRRIAAGDAYGLDHLLGAFGGMGSFNDLLVLRFNGHRIDESQEAVVNKRLVELGSAISAEATAIRRMIGSSGG